MAVSPVGTFFIVFVVLLIVAAVGWVVFTQLRARRLGVRLCHLLFERCHSFLAPDAAVSTPRTTPDIAAPALPF
jgi:hypothetical protein